MGLDQTSLLTQLTNVQTAINALLTTTSPAMRWRVGQVEMDNREYLRYLMEMQKSIVELMRSEPSESYDTVQNAIGPMGHDATEFIDENF